MKRVYGVPSLPIRNADGHKGTFGRLLVVGGSPEMLGAPVLCGTAALRSGAGLVTVAVDKGMVAAALSVTPELIGLALGDRSDKRVLEAASVADVLVIGPGMGLTPGSRRRVLGLLKADRPMVLDADALTLLSRERRWPRGGRCPRIITPHPGEMQRLGRHFGRTEIATGDRDRSELATQAARKFGVIVVLKGARTVVTDGQTVYIEPVSTSALAKAGTGDVLAGVIGAMLAVSDSPLDAAILGVHLHARAGLLAAAALGAHAVLARDVIGHLAAAFMAHASGR